MPKLAASEYTPLIPQLSIPIKEAMAIGWGESGDAPTQAHVAALVLELAATRDLLLETQQVAQEGCRSVLALSKIVQARDMEANRPGFWVSLARLAGFRRC